MICFAFIDGAVLASSLSVISQPHDRLLATGTVPLMQLKQFWFRHPSRTSLMVNLANFWPP